MMCQPKDRDNRKEIPMDRDPQLNRNFEFPRSHRGDSSTNNSSINSSDDERKVLGGEPENPNKLPIIRPDELRPYDILCGRDRATFNYIGNRRFRISIGMNIPRYAAANTKAKKAEVIQFVCGYLRSEVGVRFLKKTKKDEDYHYIELDEREARKKVGHALRDMFVRWESSRQRRTIDNPSIYDPIPFHPPPVQAITREEHQHNESLRREEHHLNEPLQNHERQHYTQQPRGIDEPQPPAQPPHQGFELPNEYAQLEQMHIQFEQRQREYRLMRQLFRHQLHLQPQPQPQVEMNPEPLLPMGNLHLHNEQQDDRH